MLHQTTIEKQLNEVFSQRQSTVLAGVISEAYDELVRAKDFNELKEIVRTLAVAQQRTEQRVEELAVAQQRTERALEHLSRQVGGLSNRLGGDLEDVAYAAIQDVLKRELGWNVGRLGPSWQQWNGKKEEVDVLGTATDPSRPHEKIWIVGEVKFNLTVKDVERFAKKVSRARSHLAGEMLAVCFCYRARPEVEEAATRNGMRMVYSYGRFV
ncbi:MAG: DUF3782 domain-containing protein [Caldilinea sp.]|jgi:predicted transcriptional regulator|nr:DUF3782 domain-containing protein [Caldilinea sp.]